MNDFILHGETLSPKTSLQVFHVNTSTYKKGKIVKLPKNQLFTRIYYNEIII